MWVFSGRHEGLFCEARPLRRSQIYSSGPPVDIVVSEIAVMMDELEGMFWILLGMTSSLKGLL